MKNKAVVVLVALLVAGFAGCAGGLKGDALRRFGETGRAVQPHLAPAADASVEALYTAFDAAIVEALKAGE